MSLKPLKTLAARVSSSIEILALPAQIIDLDN